MQAGGRAVERKASTPRGAPPSTIAHPGNAGRARAATPGEFRDVADVVAGLAALEKAFVASRDLRGVFVTAYLITTRVLADWIGRGLFRDGPLVGRYVVAFANAYREALTLYEDGRRREVPGAWLQEFDACRGGRISPAQGLLLGINAHVNHDLPRAVLRGGLHVDCDRCHEDHLRVNDALKIATPLVQHGFASARRHRLHVMDWLYDHAIRVAVASLFRGARGNAWALAATLDAAHSAAETRRVEGRIDRRATAVGRFILAHTHPPAASLATLRHVGLGVFHGSRTATSLPQPRRESAPMAVPPRGACPAHTAFA